MNRLPNNYSRKLLQIISYKPTLFRRLIKSRLFAVDNWLPDNKGAIIFTFLIQYSMSSKQTENRKGGVQVPEGWSPSSHMENDKPAQSTSGEENGYSLMMPDKSATGEASPDSHVTEKPVNSPSADDTIDAIQPEESNNTADSLQTGLSEQREQTMPTENTQPTVPKRSSGKQKKESLEEYRHTFLTVPKIEDRKPVFISCEVRDKIDEIVRKLGGRGRSVSGFIENLARHHLGIYQDDVDGWKKL
jgi:hypothetical protein